MAEAITVHCASCNTAFPVDPDKVPLGGVSARCSACGSVFRVEAPTTGTEEGGDAGSAATPDRPAGADTVVEETQAGPARPSDAGTPADRTTADPLRPADDEPGETAAGGGAGAGGTGPGEREDATSEPEPPIEGDRDAGSTGTTAPPFGAAEMEVDEPGEAGEPATGAGAAPAFGQRSPEEKAQRLARVLVSDMITYNPELYENALRGGTLEEDFEEEIEKSWEEYVEQVGEELATSTPYWRDALNEILAKGEEVF